jgi:hypothetical protein
MHDHEGDDALFEIFRKLEIDFSKPREVNFYLAFTDQTDAENALRDLAKIDFPGEVFRHDPPWWKRLFVKPSWVVSTTKDMPLDAAEIKRLTTSFASIASRHHGDYDGWEASVADDNIDGSKLDS